MTFLSTILETKREHVEKLESLEKLKRDVVDRPRDDIRFPKWSDSLDVIAEIKRRSPSKGQLADIEYPELLAREYENGGAAIISVLTDEEYFGARSDDFARVRSAVRVPVLRKDFIIDERQVYETYLMGADVMLLIVAACEDASRLNDLHKCATSLGLSVLVEAHSSAEVEIAREIGARIIGVNVRDLGTFDENPHLGDELIQTIGDGVVSVWESSISSIDDAQRAKLSGADAVLVGQTLVQHDDPAGFIAQIRNIS